MARRRRKLLWTVVGLLVGLPLVVVITMKLMRSSHSDLATVHNSVVHVRNLFTDFYAAKVGDKAILFDAGVDEDGKALDALLSELHVDRDAVTDVFLSHGHFDHVAASPLCKKARIHVGVQDSDMLALRVRHEPRGARWFRAILPVGSIMATDVFIDAAQIPFGDKTLTALPFPGHTPGSYLILYDGVLFAGDSMQIKGDKLDFCMSSFSIDPALNRKSVAGLKALLAGKKVDVVCTGHQGCTKPADTQRMLDELIARASAS